MRERKLRYPSLSSFSVRFIPGAIVNCTFSEVTLSNWTLPGNKAFYHFTHRFQRLLSRNGLMQGMFRVNRGDIKGRSGHGSRPPAQSLSVNKVTNRDKGWGSWKTLGTERDDCPPTDGMVRSRSTGHGESSPSPDRPSDAFQTYFGTSLRVELKPPPVVWRPTHLFSEVPAVSEIPDRWNHDRLSTLSLPVVAKLAFLLIDCMEER